MKMNVEEFALELPDEVIFREITLFESPGQAPQKPHLHKDLFFVYEKMPVNRSVSVQSKSPTYISIDATTTEASYVISEIMLFSRYDEKTRIFEFSVVIGRRLDFIVRYSLNTEMRNLVAMGLMSDLEYIKFLEILNRKSPTWQTKHLRVFAHILNQFGKRINSDIVIFCICKYILYHLQNRAILISDPDSPYRELSDSEIDEIGELVKAFYKESSIENQFETVSSQIFVFYDSNGIIDFKHGFAKAFGVFLSEKVGSQKNARNWINERKDKFKVGTDESIKKGINEKAHKELTTDRIKQASKQFEEVFNRLNK